MTTLPPTLEQTYQRIRRLWSWVLISPILYLLLAKIMVASGWVETFPQARHPLDKEQIRWLLGLIGAGMMATIVWLHLHRRQAVQSMVDDLPQALRRWILHFYLMVAFSDALTFISLVYFIISGRFWFILLGGACTYVGYALAYPVQKDLTGLGD